MHIRKAKIQDIVEIVRLDNASNLTPWSHQGYINCFNNKNQSIYVLELRIGLIIGVIAISKVADEAEVLQLVIAKDYQGSGYGYILLDDVLTQLKKLKVLQVFLEVREDNSPAIKLYTRLGFNIVGRRRDYYKVESWVFDALIMQLQTS